MRRLRRPLVIAAVLAVCVTSRAEAQTFIIKGAQAGSNVELVMAGAAVSTGTADPLGEVRLPATSLTTREVPEIVVHISVDVCEAGRRIVLAERTAIVPPPAVGCNRNDVSGVYVLRRETSVVIDVARTSPSVLISQGPAPPEWVNPNRRLINPNTPGLTLSAGASFVGFRDVVPNLCGDIAPCKATDYRPNYSLGARYWITRNLAADVGFARSGDTTSEGTGVGQAPFSFKSSFNARIFSIGAAFGGPAGSARIYGRAGFNRHDAVTTNVQTTDEIIIIRDDDTLALLKGGTTTLVHRTGGWSFLLGAGAEFWWKPPFGFYVEGSLGLLKGRDADSGEARIDDRTLMLLAGGRIYLGRIFTGRLFQ